MGAGRETHDEEAGALEVVDLTKVCQTVSRCEEQTGRDVHSIDEQALHGEISGEFGLKRNRQDLGWLGQFFGGGSAAPTNIAGLVTMLCLLAFVMSLFMPARAEATDAQRLVEGQTLLMGLIGSALSFIFGAATKK